VYRLAQALIPPLFFINVFKGVRFLTKATYLNALDHLLTVLRSSFSSHVQRMMTVNGSAFLASGNSANSKAQNGPRAKR